MIPHRLSTSTETRPAGRTPLRWVRSKFWLFGFYGFYGLLVLGSRIVAAAPAEEPPLPPFEDVVRAVGSYFAGVPGFQQGDLIRRSQASEALQAVAATGWEVPDAAALAERALADNSFLVRQLASGNGQAFMRKVAKMPDGFGRLDRLSTTRDGKKHIEYLIRVKDGHLLIEYMATTPGGRNLGRQLTNVPGGANFNKRTKRIYQAEQLLAELKKLYDAQRATAGK